MVELAGVYIQFFEGPAIIIKLPTNFQIVYELLETALVHEILRTSFIFKNLEKVFDVQNNFGYSRGGAFTCCLKLVSSL